MNKKISAWIYCSVDAPEDTYGKMKEQFRQLCDYAEDMEFEMVGSSSDCGGLPLWGRDGFRKFLEAVRKRKVNVLLVINRNVLSHFSMELAQLQTLEKAADVEVWSPLEGKIRF